MSIAPRTQPRNGPLRCALPTPRVNGTLLWVLLVYFLHKTRRPHSHWFGWHFFNSALQQKVASQIDRNHTHVDNNSFPFPRILFVCLGQGSLLSPRSLSCSNRTTVTAASILHDGVQQTCEGLRPSLSSCTASSTRSDPNDDRLLSGFLYLLGSVTYFLLGLIERREVKQRADNCDRHSFARSLGLLVSLAEQTSTKPRKQNLLLAFRRIACHSKRNHNFLTFIRPTLCSLLLHFFCHNHLT